MALTEGGWSVPRDEVVDGAKLGGTFAIGDGRSVLGELTVGGTNTALYLHDDEFFHIADNTADCLHGVLHDRKMVTEQRVLGAGIGEPLRPALPLCRAVAGLCSHGKPAPFRDRARGRENNLPHGRRRGRILRL